jgi:hypothetical protein
MTSVLNSLIVDFLNSNKTIDDDDVELPLDFYVDNY